MPSTLPSTATHATLFYAMQDAQFDVATNQVVRPKPVHTDMVEAPACGFQTVTWAAEHPERGWESGVMLVSRDDHDCGGSVAEILWGRGYTGTYRVVVVP